MSNDSNSVLRLPKLSKPDDYLRWKRQVYAYIRRDDPTLRCFNEAPIGNQRQFATWNEANARAKSTIVLTIGDAVIAKVRILVDDDEKTAKELWDELARIHTTSSTQTIANLQQRLDNLSFDETKKFDTHVSDFLSIVDELSSLDQTIQESEKVTKLIRSLPPSFDALAMATSVNALNFDELVIAVHANIERRKQFPAKSNNSSQPQAFYTSAHRDIQLNNRGRGRGGRGRGGLGGRGGRGGRGRGSRGQYDNRTCHYCGKSGHFIKFCRFRIQEEEGGGGRISKPNRQGRYNNGQNEQVRSLGNTYQQAQNSHSHGQQGNNQVGQFGANLSQVPQPAFDDPPPSNPYFGNPQARMARFKSKVASLSENKTDDSFIDSGATHHFFHRRSSFITYEIIKPETVLVAHGSSMVVGKGNVNVAIGNGIIVEAFHAPEFSSNILANHLLSEIFNIFYTSEDENKRCEILKKGSRTDVVHVFKCIDGLYPVKPGSNMHAKSATSHHHEEDFKTWHDKVGHISGERFKKLAQIREDVPSFSPKIIADHECVPCITAKMKKAPVRPVEAHTAPYSEVHFDLSGPMTTSLGGSTYAAHFMEPRTSKTDVIPIARKSDLPAVIMQYIKVVENKFSREGFRITRLRCDRAKENYPREVVEFNQSHGIEVNFSPAYAPESNGLAERLVQEHWTRARVMLFASDLPFNLWGEALHHANWLRNRTPSSRIDGSIPLLAWDKHASIDFKTLLTFGQAGYAFLYYPTTKPGKKLLPRSEFAKFVGMESDSRLVRVFIPSKNVLRVVRRADFHPVKGNRLPSVSSLLDGLSRQREFEDETSSLHQEEVENTLVQCMVALHHNSSILEYIEPNRSGLLRANLVPHKTHQGISDGPPLPLSFKDACNHPAWAASIDREYLALVERETWEYVKRTADMKPVPFKWSFRAKQIDDEGKEFIYKARCNLRGDLQEAYHDFDPEGIYAPVAAHESIRMLMAIAAQLGLILEGGDVSNAYLYGSMDSPITMEQPTDSTGKQARPGYVCLLRKSIYGARQAGKIWGTVLHEALLSWGFKQSTVESRVYLAKHGSSFILLTVVVDDLLFASNSRPFLDTFKKQLAAQFDVKLYGALKSFIRWNISRTDLGITASQRQYAQRLLHRFGMHGCNPVTTPLGSNCDLLPTHPSESPLSPDRHHLFRSMVGGLAYLATCTRPDLTFSVSVLARQLHNPSARHLAQVKRVLRYISGTLDYGLFFPSAGNLSAVSLRAAVDADWGGDKETRRSTTGFVIAVNCAPVMWRSKRQSVITLSSGEAEYVALSTCARELVWIRKLFWEMVHVSTWQESIHFSPTAIEVDSTAAMSMTQREDSTIRTKHISLKYHHVRELFQKRLITLVKVGTDFQVADVLTKVATIRTLARMVKGFSLHK